MAQSARQEKSGPCAIHGCGNGPHDDRASDEHDVAIVPEEQVRPKPSCRLFRAGRHAREPARGSSSVPSAGPESLKSRWRVKGPRANWSIGGAGRPSQRTMLGLSGKLHGPRDREQDGTTPAPTVQRAGRCPDHSPRADRGGRTRRSRRRPDDLRPGLAVVRRREAGGRNGVMPVPPRRRHAERPTPGPDARRHRARDRSGRHFRDPARP